MRIALPTVDYPPIEGGIATLSTHLARALAAQGHEVTVIAPWFPDTGAFDRGEPVAVVRAPGYHWGWARALPLARAAAPALRAADLVVAPNVAYGGALGRWTRLRRGTPYVCFAYAYEFLKFAANPLLRAPLRRIYRDARLTVAISRYSRQRLEQFAGPGPRVATIHPGAPGAALVAVSAQRAVRARFDLDDGPLVFALGRFIPRKGHATLVKAFARVLDRHPRAHLVMAGRGPTRAACMEKARALGIEGHVHCPGYLDDGTVAALYAACDLFALPTGEDAGGQVEGFGLVFSEAHAHGKPVVAGRAGGTPDAVLHERTGLLVPPEDSDALAAAICRLLEDPALAARLGAAGKARVAEELNWTTFAERLMAAVEDGG